MNSLQQYSKKREEVILEILKKSKTAYTTKTFHTLRVEIKKLNALFELINYCAKDFKQKKIFQPFRVVFRQAGKVREIQIEEFVLKKYFVTPLLNDYKKSLSKARLHEKKVFFSFLNKKLVSHLQKQFQEINRFLPSLPKKKKMNYIKKKKNKITRLLEQHPLQPPQIHKLRKQLKNFNYAGKFLNLKQPYRALSMEDILPGLLGKWHDGQVIITHLNKAMSANEISPPEAYELEKIKMKILEENEIFYKEINDVIRAA